MEEGERQKQTVSGAVTVSNTAGEASGAAHVGATEPRPNVSNAAKKKHAAQKQTRRKQQHSHAQKQQKQSAAKKDGSAAARFTAAEPSPRRTHGRSRAHPHTDAYGGTRAHALLIGTQPAGCGDTATWLACGALGRSQRVKRERTSAGTRARFAAPRAARRHGGHSAPTGRPPAPVAGTARLVRPASVGPTGGHSPTVPICSLGRMRVPRAAGAARARAPAAVPRC